MNGISINVEKKAKRAKMAELKALTTQNEIWKAEKNPELKLGFKRKNMEG